MDSQIRELQFILRGFAHERDWDQFHSPKNLAMALSGEVGELTEIFQWVTERQSEQLNPEQVVRAKEELADVFLYLIRLADKLDIDLVEAAHDKIELNAKKYPASQVRGQAKKYSEY